MRAEKDPKTGKWLIQYRYTDWQGKRRKSTKRGFKTKREAEEWLRNFLMTQTSDFDMKFDEFLKLYYADMFYTLNLSHRGYMRLLFQTMDVAFQRRPYAKRQIHISQEKITESISDWGFISVKSYVSITGAI